jgi:EmrB/QacA subfamily drug resistance transporter
MTQTTANAASASKGWLVVAAACLGTSVVAYNSNAVITALLAIKSSLDLDSQTALWVVNAFMLASATLIAVMGRFADIFGKLRIFLIGIGIFVAGSLIIMLAENGWMVLLGRASQGMGGAAIFTVAAALISVATPEEKRAAALGLWSASIGFGYSVGPLIGGYLTDSVNWRSIFVVDVALLAVAALLGFRVAKLGLISEKRDAGVKVDYLGVALLVVTLGTLVYGLTNGHRAGWTSLQILALFGTAALGAVLFAIQERRAHDPLVYFSFFRHGRYVAAAFGMFVTGFLFLGVLYFYNLFVQAPDGLDFTPFEAGLSILPFTLGIFVVSLTAPRLLAPFSFHWPVTIGMLTLAAGSWLMHLIGDQSSYWELWWKLAILGAGIGLSLSMLPRVGLRALPDESAGQGSGVINTCFYVGIAVGIAAGSVVTAYITHSFVGPAVQNLTSETTNTHALEMTLTHGSRSQIEKIVSQFSPADAEKIRAAMQDSLDNAFAGVMEMMAVLALAGAVVCFLAIRGAVPKKTT